MTKISLPFTHPVAVATLHGETHLKLAPDVEARQRIARHLQLDKVEKLEAHFEISHAASGLVTVGGAFEADIRPICVVSLEAFDQHLREEIAIRFAPEGLIEKMTKRAEENEDEDFEPPDAITDGAIDFGALLVEVLALALDPYPRKPGAAFSGLIEDAGTVSPFAALKALKDES